MERKAEVNFLKVDIDPILAKKRHLIITGSRRSGKSTLLREILTLPDFPADTISSEISESLRNPVSADSSLPGSCLPVFHGLGRHISDIPFLPGQAESRLQMFPGFTTHAFKQDRVELTDNLTGETSRIGIYRPKFSFHAFPADSDSGKSAASSASSGNQMVPDLNGFLGGGLASIKRAIDSPAAFAVIDELGYLESSCPEFCDAIFHLFDTKRVIAVLRSQSTPFLDALRARDDVYVYDLDHPVLPVGCVIMASGLGKRFGSNKLMADFNGKPLITRDPVRHRRTALRGTDRRDEISGGRVSLPGARDSSPAPHDAVPEPHGKARSLRAVGKKSRSRRMHICARGPAASLAGNDRSDGIDICCSSLSFVRRNSPARINGAWRGQIPREPDPL